MSDEHETRDHALSRLYREGAWPEPSRQIDQAILAASRRASRERHPLVWRFAPSFAIAATLVLTSAIVLKVYREQPAMVEPYVQDKALAPLQERIPEPKAAEAKVEAKPAAPEPQVPATPQGFSSTMDTAEALRLERAQRDLGLKEPSPQGAQPAAKTAPLPRPTSQALKKESPEPPAANRDRARADAPQTSTFSAFGASAPPPQAQTPQPAPAPSQAARAAIGKPAQLSTQPAPSGDAAPAPQAPAPASPSVAANLSAAQIAAPAATAERTPQTWIDDIRKLMKEGKSEEAGEEIAKFKKRYPEYVLPEDLR